jgi:hypothetical protein
MYTVLANNTIRRESDRAIIPTDEDNRDYVEYLAWLDEGNTPQHEFSSNTSDLSPIDRTFGGDPWQF